MTRVVKQLPLSRATSLRLARRATSAKPLGGGGSVAMENIGEPGRMKMQWRVAFGHRT